MNNVNNNSGEFCEGNNSIAEYLEDIKQFCKLKNPKKSEFIEYEKKEERILRKLLEQVSKQLPEELLKEQSRKLSELPEEQFKKLLELPEEPLKEQLKKLSELPEEQFKKLLEDLLRRLIAESSEEELKELGEFRENLINANLKRVVKIARQYINQGVPFANLIQEGNLGLIMAVNRFDPEGKTPFCTYITSCIRNRIIITLKQDDKDKITPLTDISNDDKISQIKPIFYNGLDPGAELGEMIDKMKPRTKDIIYLTLGLNQNSHPLSFAEIGKMMRITRERVRQIYAKAMTTLQKELFYNLTPEKQKEQTQRSVQKMIEEGNRKNTLYA